MASKLVQHPLALLVQVENNFDTLKIVGRVVYTDEARDPGQYLNPSWDYGANASSVFDGFQVSAYLGGLPFSSYQEAEQGTWGFSYSFQPYQIARADHALAVARLFAKLDRGMEAITSAEGYLDSDEFHTYLLRVARVLKIKKIVVRSNPRQFGYTGQRYREVDGSGLQSFIQDKVQQIKDGRRGEVLADLRG